MLHLGLTLSDLVGALFAMGEVSSEILLRDLGLGHIADTSVALLIGDLTVRETIDYARILMEQGRAIEAEELAMAALAAAAGAVVQTAQVRWVTWRQGSQAVA